MDFVDPVAALAGRTGQSGDEGGDEIGGVEDVDVVVQQGDVA